MGSMARLCVLLLFAAVACAVPKAATASTGSTATVSNLGESTLSTVLSLGYTVNNTVSLLAATAAAMAAKSVLGSSVLVSPQPLALPTGATYNLTTAVMDVSVGRPMVRFDLPVTETYVQVLPGDITQAVVPDYLDVDVLGVSGIAQRPGLYIPDYLAASNPELRTWTGLAAGNVTLVHFDGKLLVGPESYFTALACGKNSTVGALGLNVTCVTSKSWGQQLVQLTELQAARQPFLALLVAPSRASLLLNVTRVQLPSRSLACLAQPHTPCDFALFSPRKLTWSEIPEFFQPGVPNFLKAFSIGAQALETMLIDVITAPGGRGEVVPQAAIDGAVSKWTSSVANQVRSWVSVPEIHAVTPDHGPTAGSTTVIISGFGFGKTRPPTVGASIGGVRCLNSAWVNDTALSCLTPSGVGINHTVAVSVGFQSAFGDVKFTYDAAVLRGVFTQAALAVLNTEDENVATDNRRASLGQSLLLVGFNFYEATTMQCRIGGAVSIATFINATAVSCTLTHVASGVVDVEVSNDGVRWVSGLDIDVDKVTWAGLSTTPPLDYTSSEAPSLVTIAAVMPANLRSLYEHFLGRAVETVNNSTSMLPFTKLRFVAYTETDIITQVGAARDEAAATMLQAMIDDADTAGAPLVGILGAYSSSVSQPLAIANSRHPYPRVQCAVSTADTLSSPTLFPYFLRAAPPDRLQATAAAMLVGRLLKDFATHSLVDGANPRLGWITAENDLYSEGISERIKALLPSFGVDLAYELEIVASDILVLPTQASRVAAVSALLMPYLGSEENVVGLVAPLELLNIVMLAANETGFAADKLWISTDTATASVEMLNHAASALITSPGGGASDKALALAQQQEELFGQHDAMLPFAVDCVPVIANAVDVIIQQARTTSAAAIAALGKEITAVARRASSDLTMAVTPFGGFLPGTNDPSEASIEISNVHQPKQFDVVGRVEDRVIFTKSVVLPTSSAKLEVPTELKIGLEIDGPDAFGALLGAETAIATINAAARSGDAEAVLSNITLVGVLYQRNATVGEADIVQQAVADGVLAMVTFLGSDASIKLSRAAEAHRLPVLSSYATLSALSSPTLFPFFARPIPPDSQQGVALVDLCRKYRWLHVATVHDPSSGYSVGLEADFVSQTNDGGIQVLGRFEVQPSTTAFDLEAMLTSLQFLGAHVIVVLLNAPEVCRLMQAAADSSLPFTKDGTVVWLGCDSWMMSGACASEFAGTNALVGAQAAMVGAIGTAPNTGQGVTADQFWLDLRKQASGSLADNLRVGAVTPELMTAYLAWRAALPTTFRNWRSPSTRDAVLLAAKSFGEIMAEKQRLDNGNTIMSYVRRVSINATSGELRVAPGSNNPVTAAYEVANVARNGSDVVVGVHLDRGYVNVTGCPPGEYLTIHLVCNRCPPDTYKDVTGNTDCTRCFPGTSTNGTFGARHRTQCLCPAGKYTLDTPSSVDGQPCAACPVGALCPHEGMRLPGLLSAKGYWRGNPNSTAFDECLDANSCLSGTTALRDAILADGGLEQMYSTPCRDGSFGPMCRVCQQGFGPNILGECSQCAGTAPGFILLALGGVMLGCFVFYLVWQQVVPRTLAARIKRRRTMLKVFITFLQYNSILAGFRIMWDRSLLNLFRVQSSSAVAVASIVSWDCLFPGTLESAYKAFFVSSSVPLAIVAVGLLALFIRWCKGVDETFWFDCVVATFNITVFLQYPSLVSQIMDMQDCVEVSSLPPIDGQTASFLRTDFTVSCVSARYSVFWHASQVLVGVYVVGVPVTYAVVLWYKRGSMWFNQSDSVTTGLLVARHARMLTHALQTSAAAERRRMQAEAETRAGKPTRASSMTFEPLTSSSGSGSGIGSQPSSAQRDRRARNRTANAVLTNEQRALAESARLDPMQRGRRGASKTLAFANFTSVSTADNADGESGSHRTSRLIAGSSRGSVTGSRKFARGGSSSLLASLRGSSFRRSFTNALTRSRNGSGVRLVDGQITVPAQVIAQRLRKAEDVFRAAQHRLTADLCSQPRARRSEAPLLSDLLNVAYDRVRAHIKNDDLSCSMAVRQVVASLEDTLTTQRRFSFLYSSYRKSRYWFEIFTMLRKSAIVMAEVLLSTAQWQNQFAAGLFLTGFALFVNVQWSPYQNLVAVQQKMLAFGGSGTKRPSRGAGSSAGAGSETDAILTRSKAHSITARDSPRSVSERPRATHTAQPAANARRGTWIVRSSKHNRPDKDVNRTGVLPRIMDKVEPGSVNQVALVVTMFNLCAVMVSTGVELGKVKPTAATSALVFLVNIVLMAAFATGLAIDFYPSAKMHLLQATNWCSKHHQTAKTAMKQRRATARARRDAELEVRNPVFMGDGQAAGSHTRPTPQPRQPAHSNSIRSIARRTRKKYGFP